MATSTRCLLLVPAVVMLNAMLTRAFSPPALAISSFLHAKEPRCQPRGRVRTWQAHNVGMTRQGAVHFINLSNGLEALPMLAGVPVAFTRIQSSHCESRNFNGIVNGLDNTLLLYLALGQTCYIHDYGSRNKKRKAPRAIWYGVTFIRYALHKIWELPGEPDKPMLRGHNVAADFDYAINNLDKTAKKRLKYFQSYVQTEEVKLLGVVGPTDIDGRRDLHVELAKEHASSVGSLVQDIEYMPWQSLESLEVFDTKLGFKFEEE
eukprot:767075-Hanusia_phi.AAC.1